MNDKEWNKSFDRTVKVTETHIVKRREYFEQRSKKDIKTNDIYAMREQTPLPRQERTYHGETYFNIAGVKCFLD